MQKDIIIKGARENNLKNINVTIPRNKLVVLTGVSGSGKSTLAFDTIFAEGQRRYMESLSSYARQFLGQMHKPDVDIIEGLSPSISIDQKTTSNNPRSTVGTVTEIYDYLRLLYAHIGVAYCPNCKKPISSQTIDNIIDQIMTLQGKKILVCAPVFRGKKGTFAKEIDEYRKNGYSRIIVDGTEYMLTDDIVLEKTYKHDIDIVVDRIIVKSGVEHRLTESVEIALKEAKGIVLIREGENEYIHSTNHACPTCGYSIPEITPRLFSFNNPFGACPECAGLGVKQSVEESKIVRDKKRSLFDGAIIANGWSYDAGMVKMFYRAVLDYYDIDYDTPYEKLPKKAIDMIMYGTKGEKIQTYLPWHKKYGMVAFEGIVNNLLRRMQETHSETIKDSIQKMLVDIACPVCHGNRLQESALNIKINKKNIIELTNMSVDEISKFFENLKLNATEQSIANPILKEVKSRLSFLQNVGLNYLTLSRLSGTLSGGESQRIRLATQIGSGLTGVMYILDEPSIGLHQRDNDRLLATLTNLRDLDNTVIVVEHDEDTMRASDYIIDIGPYAGVNGGEVVACGTVDEIEKCDRSITGQYLSGKKKIAIPQVRRKIENGYLKVIGAKQNNLKNINVEIPVGLLTCITGVSGSGKSSLINGILYPATANVLNHAELKEGNYKKIEGLEKFDKVINIDQSPIGRTPRSNPATYTGLFTDIRELFASLPSAKERGYAMSRFSFNIKGGRCEKCGGAGINTIEMFFLPDIFVTCDECNGKRYNRETLEVKYKGKSIYDVLNMPISEAYEFFDNLPKLKNKLKSLVEVGLGYIKLGQPATELSGGEAQRVKLATELCKRSTGKTLYILDEPTTGLHMYDVDKLITILQRLVGNGNTVVVIEHNLDVIKVADYIIDLGPEGGNEGGNIVACGTPEQVAKNENSYTGKYLKKILKNAK